MVRLYIADPSGVLFSWRLGCRWTRGPPQGRAWAEQEPSLRLHTMLSSATVPSLGGPNTLQMAVSCPCASHVFCGDLASKQP